MPATLSVHRHTPTLTTLDPRRLAVRGVGFWRDNDGMSPWARVNRTVHDWAGRAIAQWDPRLFLDASAPPNLQTVYALSGAVLSTSSVDAGWRMALLGEAGQAVHQWDGRGSQLWMVYDTQVRPLSVFEHLNGGQAICTERMSYGDPGAAEHNQCGQLIRHNDPAGTQLFTEFELHGAVLAQARHFLRDLAMPDWPESIADRERMLEPGDGATTRSRFNAPGEAIQQTDAKGHRQFFSQTLDGQLRAVHLQLNGASTAKTLLSAITYNAHGQTEREVAGNGVITTLEYDAADGRLTRLQALRDNEILQDLGYVYDPVGNVLGIEDAALPIRYFANQRVEPISRYCYDTLYQLIEATGWEAGATNKGPSFSNIADPQPVANYRQRYRYDQGGNLLELIHEGPQQHGHRLVAAAHNNRCLPVLAGVEPDEADFRRGFNANGNLLNLQPGQALNWDPRNQLREVRPVERDSCLDDYERYVYGADGMRVRKVRSLQTNARTLISEVRYLPNLELRSHSGTGEVLQVISVQAGRNSVRVLHWESAPPKDSANDQCRYSLNDHLGSCTLELDDAGEVISQERYHPFGTTAWFAGRGEVEASYKTARYSGKERDATGLYYYGFRYYVPWLQRWLNPDPAGEVGGFNLYVMVINNPVNRVDPDGLKPLLFGVKREVETARKNSISYSEAAIEILKSGDSSLVQSVMLKYFNDASSERISRWVNDLLKVIDVAKMTKIHRNLELIDDDYEGGIYKKSVAMVDGKKYSDFKVYSDSIFRTIRNFSDNKKELAEQLKDKKNQYKAQRNKKFLLVNQKNWNVFKELGGEAMLVSAAIHEFSHVAVGTQDYVYKRILEGKNNTPLFDLAAGQPSADSRLPALTRLISETGRNLNYSDVAYSNADSFAEATVALVKTFGGVKRLKSGKGNSIAPRAYK